jgi:hypothetical protein
MPAPREVTTALSLASPRPVPRVSGYVFLCMGRTTMLSTAKCNRKGRVAHDRREPRISLSVSTMQKGTTHRFKREFPFG